PERDRVRLLRIADRVQQNGEFVAAQARERVALAQARLEAPRHRCEQLVADEMAEAVVDHLEAIEIEIERRERITDPLPLHVREAPAETLDEVRPVVETGERIAELHRAQLPLRRRPFGR